MRCLPGGTLIQWSLGSVFFLKVNFEIGGRKQNNWVVVSNIFYFHPEPWEMIQFDDHVYQMGWFNHKLDNIFPQILSKPSCFFLKFQSMTW